MLTRRSLSEVNLSLWVLFLDFLFTLVPYRYTGGVDARLVQFSETPSSKGPDKLTIVLPDTVLTRSLPILSSLHSTLV